MIKKIKKDPSDDYDTEYVDVDVLMTMYVDWFKSFKVQQQQKLMKQFQRVIDGAGESSELSIDNISSIMSNLQQKQNYQFLSFGGNICQLRAFIYATMCGKNGFNCSEPEFIAGCNRYGLDNPTPIITRRLATYGNEETVDKIIEREAKRYDDEKFLDHEKFSSIHPDRNQQTTTGIDGSPSPIRKHEDLNIRDMEETKIVKRTKQKVTGVQDIKILDKMENTKKFESPANIILARNIQIKIKDIPKNTTLQGLATP